MFTLIHVLHVCLHWIRIWLSPYVGRSAWPYLWFWHSFLNYRLWTTSFCRKRFCFHSWTHWLGPWRSLFPKANYSHTDWITLQNKAVKFLKKCGFLKGFCQLGKLFWAWNEEIWSNSKQNKNSLCLCLFETAKVLFYLINNCYCGYTWKTPMLLSKNCRVINKVCNILTCDVFRFMEMAHGSCRVHEITSPCPKTY